MFIILKICSKMFLQCKNQEFLRLEHCSGSRKFQTFSKLNKEKHMNSQFWKGSEKSSEFSEPFFRNVDKLKANDFQNHAN